MTIQDIHTRFERQISLPNFGLEAQQKIMASSVLIIGMGGLGCPALQYLVAAGVGRIGIVDGDSVAIHNLHRQILFTSQDVGLQKVAAALEKVKHIHPHIQFETYPEFISKNNAIDLISSYDIVLDCTDRFSARYLINDVCVLKNKPFIFGALFQFQGQLAVFNHGERRTTLRDLFPNQPYQNDYPSCQDAGTLGMLPGIIGTMQALECIKWITHQQGLLYNTLLTYDLMQHTQLRLRIAKNNDLLPIDLESFLATVYEIDESSCENINHQEDLDMTTFIEKIKEGNALLIDVRNPNELPLWNEFETLQIPLSDLPHSLHQLDESKTILLFCHAGIRSQTALEFLKDECNFEHVFHLKGGLLKWLSKT
jgi:adenylyltransferase/sulfurtransferase